MHDSILTLALQLANSVLAAPSPILAAAIVVVYYFWQSRLARRRKISDEFVHRLYEFLGLASKYWNSPSSSNSDRDYLIAQMSVAEKIITIEFERIASLSPKLKKWHRNEENTLFEMVDAAMGNSLKLNEWEPKPRQVTKAAKLSAELVHSLNQAC